MIKCEHCRDEIKEESYSTTFANCLCEICYYGGTGVAPITENEFLIEQIRQNKKKLDSNGIKTIFWPFL